MNYSASLDQIPNIALRIYQAKGLDDTLQTAVDEIRQFLNTDRVTIYKMDQSGIGQIFAESVGAEWLSIKQQQIVDRCFPEVYWKKYAQGTISVVENLEGDIQDCYRSMLVDCQVKSYIVLPILFNQHELEVPKFYIKKTHELKSQNSNLVWGLIIIHHCSHQRKWRPVEILFLKKLAIQIGFIIQRIKLQKRSESLIDSSTDGIIAFDRDLRLITWNQRMQEISGISREAIMGEMILEKFPWLWEIQEDYYILQALQGRSVISNNKQFPWPNIQSQHYFEARYSPLFEETGQIIGGICVLRDITQQEIIQAQLEKAKDASEQANQAKTDFLTTMSHEIRTPMNAVLGMASFLLDTQLTPEQRSYVNGILKGGDTLLKLINEILDFSKIEAGKLELEYQTFCLRTCIQEAQDLVAVQANSKKIQLTATYASNLPDKIIGDPTKLKQILVNLLSNAIKFTNSGAVSIRISVVKSASEEGLSEKVLSQDLLSQDLLPQDGILPESKVQSRLEFAISDTGIGIAAQKIHRLFTAFSQADSSINRQYGGTGLGLAISKQLCELMGGQIWVESRGVTAGNPPAYFEPSYSDGSTFYFTIATSEEKIDDLTSEGPLPDTSSQYALQEDYSKAWSASCPLKILIVDDVSINQQILLKMLNQFGYHADIAAGGAEAYTIVQKSCYDLILMDIQMPEIDGITATEMIREIPHFPIQPWIVAVTAHAMSGVRETYLSKGMDDYLVKPIQKASLIQILKRAREYHQGNTKLVRASQVQSNQGIEVNLQKFLESQASFDINIIQRLRQMLGDDADTVLLQLFQNYLEDSLIALERMQIAISHQNTKDIREFSHALRSASLNLGALNLAHLCQVLENMGREQDLVASEIQLQKVLREYENVQLILQTAIRNGCMS